MSSTDLWRGSGSGDLPLVPSFLPYELVEQATMTYCNWGKHTTPIGCYALHVQAVNKFTKISTKILCFQYAESMLLLQCRTKHYIYLLLVALLVVNISVVGDLLLSCALRSAVGVLPRDGVFSSGDFPRGLAWGLQRIDGKCKIERFQTLIVRILYVNAHPKTSNCSLIILFSSWLWFRFPEWIGLGFFFFFNCIQIQVAWLCVKIK